MNKYKDSKLTYFFRMFSFMLPYMPTYIPGLIIYCSQGFIFPLVNSYFLRSITAEALNSNIRGIIYAILVYIGLYTGFFPALVSAGVIAYNTSEVKALRSLKAKLFRRFVKTSLESSMSSHSGEGIAAINTDADTASYVYGNTLSPLLSCIISIVFSALVVFLVDYRLGLASIAIGLLAFIIQYKFAKPLGEIGEQRLSANAASVKSMSDIFSGALAIRAFNAQQRAVESFDRENGKLLTLSYKKAFLSMWQDFFTTIQGWLTLTGVFTLGGYLVATSRLSFPALMMVPAMCQAIANGMSGIGGAWAAMQAPIAASKRILAILDGDSGEEEPVSRTEAQLLEDVKSGGYTIKINNMSFKYLTGETNALDGINLEIGENEMVAFVGESGSGKSTLLRTLIGMYEREGLDMYLGSLRFNRAGIHMWRRKFAYVDQSCKLFDMTIAENIALGAVKPSMAEIKEAAAAAHANAFISSLAEGYDTPCGEKGASLSGGQKQRIAIARALVRKAPILVFDEATSALDTESEKQIMKTINTLRESHTILIITHNLHNIVNADKIIVMDKGRIAEIGRHDELMACDGVYKKLFLHKQKE